MGFVVFVIVAILLLGLVFKLVKIAIILALGVGVVMLTQKHFGTKRIK